MVPVIHLGSVTRRKSEYAPVHCFFRMLASDNHLSIGVERLRVPVPPRAPTVRADVAIITPVNPRALSLCEKNRWHLYVATPSTAINRTYRPRSSTSSGMPSIMKVRAPMTSRLFASMSSS